MRIIGYTRRSKERHNGFGLKAQRDAIQRWADYEQAELVDVLADDDVTGVLEPEERPGLGKALSCLRSGQADALVVAKFDRLARSFIAFADVLRLSEREGWALICLDPFLDLRTAHSRAMAGMLIGFADVEREAFRDRMQAARRAKADRGGYVGGTRLHRRYGFRLVEQPNGKHDYEPVPEEQEAIAAIKRGRAGGETLQTICNALMGLGVASPSGSATWHPATVKRIAERTK